MMSLIHILRSFKLQKRRTQLQESWGTVPETAFDIDIAKILFNLADKPLITDSTLIDENTWHDLDMDDIFFLLNRATTPLGAQYLFYLLKHPVFSKDELNRRENLIDHFSKNQTLRENVQLSMRHLAEKNAKYLPYSLWKPLPDKPMYAKFLPFLSLLSIVTLAAVLFQIAPISFLLPIFIVNLVIHTTIKRKIEPFIHSFRYLGIFIGAAHRIVKLKDTQLNGINETLKSHLKHIDVIAKKMYTLQLKDETGLLEYVKIYFLADVTGFYAAVDAIAERVNELRETYKILGYLDALISIASFRVEYPHFCHPNFSENTTDFIVEEIYNPLLEEPVENTFSFDAKNIIITGSNMAGKTTFLKTMGVNAIFAQTMNVCMAKSYTAPFIKVISSIGRSDNLIFGKSYYLAEVESILRLLTASETPAIHLFIVDEIFRGTNSVERLAASIEVLKYLANEKDFILVATHDLQLSEILKKDYHNFHFRENVCNDGLTFDYKLHPGRSTTRNAIALLEYVGYPASIVENAKKRLENK